MQEGTGKLFDARQRPVLDRTESCKIHRRHLGDLKAARAAARLRQRGLDEILHVFFCDAALGAAAAHLREVYAQFAREAADGRAGVRLATGDGGLRYGRHGGRGRGCSGCCRMGRLRRGRGGRLCLGGRCAGGFRTGFQQRDQVAFGDLVANLDLEFLHHPGERRGYVHGCLVGFQSDQRILGLYRVARTDHHLDDLDILEVADVRHQYLFYFCHVISPLKP